MLNLLPLRGGGIITTSFILINFYIKGMVLKQKSKVEARGEAAEPASAGQQLLEPHPHQQQLQHQCLPGHPTAHHTG